MYTHTMYTHTHHVYTPGSRPISDQLFTARQILLHTIYSARKQIQLNLFFLFLKNLNISRTGPVCSWWGCGNAAPLLVAPPVAPLLVPAALVFLGALVVAGAAPFPLPVLLVLVALVPLLGAAVLVALVLLRALGTRAVPEQEHI